MGIIFSSRVSEKERYMLSNGSLLLEELLRSCDGKYNPFRIFSAKEVAQATSNYNGQFVDTDYCIMYDGFLNGRGIFVKYPRKYPGEYGERCLEKAINEVVFASQVNNHKNILMLLGCCLETEFPVLVYEYADNGSLSNHIFRGTAGSHNHRQLLSWNCRLKVANEIADALAYLHTGLPTPIIHRCIKADNIVLDENYVAKLSEFSLSVSIPLGEECLETSVVGTTGYGAPEYIATGKLTDKCDVYLFGPLLIEILCGERYMDLLRRFWILRDTLGIHKSRSNWVSSGACNLVNGVVEGRDCDHGVASNQRAEMDMEYIHRSIVVGGGGGGGAAENMLESRDQLKQSKACSQLAFECLKQSAQERPTMTQVAKELRRIIRFEGISP